MYQSKYFEAHELLPKMLYYATGDRAMRMADPKLLMTIDQLKETFPQGAIYINNYAWGKDREWSGLRLPNSPYYSPRSYHSSFQAADLVFTAYDINMVRRHILANQEHFPHIGGIELNVGWGHFDMRPRRNGKIITFTQ